MKIDKICIVTLIADVMSKLPIQVIVHTTESSRRATEVLHSCTPFLMVWCPYQERNWSHQYRKPHCWPPRPTCPKSDQIHSALARLAFFMLLGELKNRNCKRMPNWCNWHIFVQKMNRFSQNRDLNFTFDMSLVQDHGNIPIWARYLQSLNCPT